MGVIEGFARGKDGFVVLSPEWVEAMRRANSAIENFEPLGGKLTEEAKKKLQKPEPKKKKFGREK